MLQPNVVAEPLPGMQTLLLRCPCFEVFAGGSRGPGKTSAMLLDWIAHQDEYGKLAIGLMVRRTYKQLVDTIQAAKRWFIPLGANWIASGIDYGTFFFPNGAMIRFRYLASDSDAEEYQGHSYTRVYCEEMGNFPDPTPILKLMATLRSKYGVRVGFRATGNPGGVGHNWIKQRYVTPAPLGLKVITTTYINPWTREPIIRDRVYVPGTINDNPYLGSDYVANLQMQASPKLVRAWLMGDWSAVEGAFFDNFNAEVHCIRPFQIPARWARFRAGDWGSYHPFSFGWYSVVSDDFAIRRDDGRISVIPRGAMIKYREWYGMQPGHYNTGIKLTVEQAADGILAREMEEPRSINGKSGVTDGVLDPSCFQNHGGPSIAERFGNKKIFWREADNTRAGRAGAMGGWDLIRHRLDGDDGRPMLYFFDTCVDTIRTLPELQHDEAKPEDVDCWIAGTMISTPSGDKAIENICIGDFVDTPIGPRMVEKSYLSGSGSIVCVTLSDGRNLEGTPHHKIYIKNKGLIALEALLCHDIPIERNISWQRKSLSIAVLLIHDIKGVYTTIQMGQFWNVVVRAFIGRCGSMLAEKFLQVGMSIIRMMITITMKSATLNVCPQGNMVDCISRDDWQENLESNLRHGAEAKPAKTLCVTTPARCTNVQHDVNVRAEIVASLLLLDILQRYTVPAVVLKLKQALRKLVQFVEANFELGIILRKKSKPVHIVAVGRSDVRTKVYNLTVSDAHLFYANGILSSNTDGEDHAGDETRYACASRPWIRKSHRTDDEAISEANEYGTVKISLEKVFQQSEKSTRKTRRL